jgi:hypothetical protein
MASKNEPRRAELALALIVNNPAVGVGSDSAVVGDKTLTLIRENCQKFCTIPNPLLLRPTLVLPFSMVQSRCVKTFD